MARKRSLKRPICLGHEAVGRVTETGPAVRSLAVGQRVVLVPGAACAAMERSPECEMCERGLPLLCLHRDDFVPQLNDGGGWSESFVRHESALMPVPDDVSDDQAVLLDPLASSVHAALRRPPAPNDTVIVIGCGAIGLGIILALRALAIPVRIVAIAKHSYQATHARAMGADAVLQSRMEDLYEELARELNTEVHARGRGNRLLHHGASVVYDAVGSGETLHHALRWTKPRGAVVLEGIAPRPANLDRTVIWLREVDVLGAHGHGREIYEGDKLHTFELVMKWIRQNRLDPGALITHRFPLREYRDAIRVADNKLDSAAIKVVLEMPDHG